MKLKLLRVLLLGTGLFSVKAWADELVDEYDRWKTDQKDNIKTYQGMRFQLPKDYPIKQYDGYIAPIPFEEYAYIKFEKATKLIAALEKRVVVLEEKLKDPAPKNATQ